LNYLLYKNLKIIKDLSLAKYTTFKIGGRAKYSCFPSNPEEIKLAFLFAQENNLPYFIIGGGANLLISDKGYNGLIIFTHRLNKYKVKNNCIETESGITLTKLNRIALFNFLSGLEFSNGLPGSIGGAVFMNARCYGKEFSDIVESVIAIDKTGNIIQLNKKEIFYAYKKTYFMDNRDLFIYKVILKLEKSKFFKILKEANKNKKDRIKKGQFLYPSAGCIFKNDYSIGIPSGKIIEDLGLKGVKIGGAKVYEKHANFIINYKNAKANDVFELIKFIENSVYERKGYKLEKEVQLLGDFQD